MLRRTIEEGNERNSAIMSDYSVIQAVKAGNIKAVKKASKKDLSKTDESGWCSIHWAAWSGNREVLSAILHKW